MTFGPGNEPKRILIHARIVDGKLVGVRSGKEFPTIADETVVHVSIPSEAFKNQDDARQLTELHRVLFLKAGTKLLVQLTVKQIPPALRDVLTACEVMPEPRYPVLFAAVELEEDLHLYLEGFKKPTLGNVKCKVPILDGLEIISLNQAHTELSKAFERKRRSNTANVFSTLYYQRDGAWVLLEELRKSMMEQHVSKLFVAQEKQEEVKDEDLFEDSVEAVEDRDPATTPALEWMDMTMGEHELLGQISLADVVRRKQPFYGKPGTCSICNVDLETKAVFVDSQVKGDKGRANLCADCHLRFGVGLGIGQGQAFWRMLNGAWLLVAGA